MPKQAFAKHSAPRRVLHAFKQRFGARKSFSIGGIKICNDEFMVSRRRSDNGLFNFEYIKNGKDKSNAIRLARNDTKSFLLGTLLYCLEKTGSPTR